MPRSFIIGYTVDDPLFYRMRAGEGMIQSGRCGSCRRNVWLNPSGVDALKERDSAIYCNQCAHDRREYDHMIADLDL